MQLYYILDLLLDHVSFFHAKNKLNIKRIHAMKGIRLAEYDSCFSI